MKIALNDPEKSFYCPIKKHRGKALLNCPNCDHYPCDALRPEDIKYLQANLPHESEWLEKIRGKKMFIIEKEDGTLIKKDKFDVKNPTEKDLKGIDKVYECSKCYQKQVKLVQLRPSTKKKADK
jgi:hypothetical protein